jgi:CheY-like chemotaxis protein
MGNKKRILIVEDERLLAVTLEERLERLGYDVLGRAASGEKAVEYAEKFEPDLIIMDIALEGEMDGITAVEEIHKKNEIPVVYLTASSDTPMMLRANRTKHSGYLKKPVRKDDLENTINAILGKD